MSFDDLLNKTPEEKETLIKQALRKQEYNRNYQRKLRTAAKLATLERKIDENLDYVIAYIHTRYADKYDDWRPEQPREAVDPAFSNWVLLSAPGYKSVKEAFELSGLRGVITLDQFEKWFKQHYKKENNKGDYIKS